MYIFSLMSVCVVTMETSSNTGLYLDAQAGLDFLLSRRDIDHRKFIVFGRSLGGAVAIYLTASLSNMDK